MVNSNSDKNIIRILTVVGTAIRGFKGPGGGKPLPDLVLETHPLNLMIVQLMPNEGSMLYYCSIFTNRRIDVVEEIIRFVRRIQIGCFARVHD